MIFMYLGANELIGIWGRKLLQKCKVTNKAKPTYKITAERTLTLTLQWEAIARHHSTPIFAKCERVSWDPIKEESECLTIRAKRREPLDVIF